MTSRPLSPTRGGSHKPFSVPLLIRDILMESGDDAYPMYVHTVLKARIQGLWAEAAERLEASKGRHVTPNYLTVATYLSIARRKGLVEYTGQTRPSANPSFLDVRFIRIVPGNEGDDLWGALLSNELPDRRPTISQPRPLPPLPAPASPEEVAALNAQYRDHMLTSKEFEEAVELLTSGRVATAEEASALAIRTSQRGQRGREQAKPPVSPAVQAVQTAWEGARDRVTGYARPNSANAEKVLDAFVGKFPDMEDDLDTIISDVRAALEEYRDLDRGDYDNAEEYSEARSQAWETFTQALQELEMSEELESEE